MTQDAVSKCKAASKANYLCHQRKVAMLTTTLGTQTVVEYAATYLIKEPMYDSILTSAAWSESHPEQSHNLWPYTKWRSALPLRTLSLEISLHSWRWSYSWQRILQAKHLYNTDIRYTLIKHWPLGSLQQSHQASPFWEKSDTRQWVHSVDSFGHRQENTENTAYLHLYISLFIKPLIRVRQPHYRHSLTHQCIGDWGSGVSSPKTLNTLQECTLP